MRKFIWIIRFHHWDGSVDEQEYSVCSLAWHSFRLFAEPDSADIYKQVDICKYDRVGQCEKILARMEFMENPA